MKFLIIGNSHVAVSYNMTTDDRPLLSYPSSFFHLDDHLNITEMFQSCKKNPIFTFAFYIPDLC